MPKPAGAGAELDAATEAVLKQMLRQDEGGRLCSGQSAARLGLAFAATILTGTILGSLYGLACYINPLVYFNFLATIVVGTLGGYVAGRMLGRDRELAGNGLVMLGLVLIVLLVLDASSFPTRAIDHGLVLSPQGVWEAIGHRLHDGYRIGLLRARVLSGVPIRGIGMGIVLLLEAAVIGWSALYGLVRGVEGKSLADIIDEMR